VNVCRTLSIVVHSGRPKWTLTCPHRTMTKERQNLVQFNYHSQLPYRNRKRPHPICTVGRLNYSSQDAIVLVVVGQISLSDSCQPKMYLRLTRLGTRMRQKLLPRSEGIRSRRSNDADVFIISKLQRTHKFEASEDSIFFSLLLPVSILLETLPYRTVRAAPLYCIP
jgi:hypothetical protein